MTKDRITNKTMALSHRHFLLLPLLIPVAIAVGLLLVCPWADSPTPSSAREQWISVQPQVLENRLGLIGRIQAVQQKILTAPFDSFISEVLTHEGQQVESGQMLLRLDTAQVDIQLRQARIELLKAKREARQLQNWDSSIDVLRARRGVQSAHATLSNTQANLSDTRALFERGIVARIEVETLAQQEKNQQQDLLAAKEELRTVEARGTGEELRIAEMNLINAQAHYQAVSAQREEQELRAPFAGVVMRPVAPDSGKAIVVQPGQQVSQGTPLFVVAGLNRLQVLTQVEETDLYQLKVGMPVQITGDGFSGLILRGNVTSIGMQSNAAESQGAYYDVVVEMDRSLPESRQDIRLGMSAHLQVILHRNENGFAVPVEALSYGEDGKAYILWRPTSGEPMQKVAVTPGKAVAQGVEVSGIDAGEILVPRTHPDNLTSIEPMSINLESH